MGRTKIPSAYYGNFKRHLPDISGGSRYLLTVMSSVYPGVSVVLPILNEERDLAPSIESILKQDWRLAHQKIAQMKLQKNFMKKMQELFWLITQLAELPAD
jgi:cellulose synthase/poly-beta-1,6-N-acetylglucosamine synthase-like glycosyltransferase